MNVNYQTDKLIVANYPKGSGGNFILYCLGIHPKVLPLHETLAKIKIKKPFDLKLGFDIARKVLEKKSKTNDHFEFGGGLLAGFNFNDMNKDTNSDKKLCNDFWKELTNKNEHYFYMIDHTDKELYHRYINRKTLVLKNYEWILEARNNSLIDGHGSIDLVGKNHNYINFNMDSIKTGKFFSEEIGKLFDFLGLEFDSFEYLEELRTLFLDTLKIGFTSNELTQNL
jgi:hypothetical protein